jgi:hypothetical protein
MAFGKALRLAGVVDCTENQCSHALPDTPRKCIIKLALVWRRPGMCPVDAVRTIQCMCSVFSA